MPDNEQEYTTAQALDGNSGLSFSDKERQWLEELLQLTDGDTRKKTAKQARILEAAIEIFAEKGYAATSTSEIAKKAGVAEGTIFRHYKTKNDLLLAIAGPIAAKLIAPFLMYDFAKLLDLPFEQVDDLFRAIAKNRIAFARNNAKLIKILLSEVPYQPELMEQLKTLVTRIILARIHRIIEHFQEQGQIVAAPPWRIIRTAVSVMMGMVVFHVFIAPDFPIDEDEEIERTLDMLMYGLAGRRPGPF